MGKEDTAMKAYMSQNRVFADIFNFYLYQGEQVIVPEQLREMDSAELSMPYGVDGNGELVQKYRDLLKELAVMEDENATYLLLGIENQSHVHYAAPVKNLLYDVLQYAKQVERAASRHREAKDYKGHNSGEFLSGFYKQDKLIPVITLLVFFSPEPWDGPRSLSEMMITKNPKILSMLPEYRVHLISPSELEEEDFGKFHTTLGDVLEFIKYSNDKEKLVGWLEAKKTELALGRKEVEVLNASVKANLTIEADKEVVNVCKAIEDLKAEAVEKEQLRGLKNLMHNMHWTAEQAAAAWGIPPEDTKKLLKML